MAPAVFAAALALAAHPARDTILATTQARVHLSTNAGTTWTLNAAAR